MNSFIATFPGYYCVFTGSPKRCHPYATFANKSSAEFYHREVSSRFKIITVAEWAELQDEAKPARREPGRS
jgi:hypothetical protein